MVNHLLPSSAAEALCFTHCAADACVSHDASVLWEVYSLTRLTPSTVVFGL